MKKESVRKLWLVSFFAIAFGFVEACVVVYLRKIYYPDGFGFPLRGFIEPHILGVEWIREFFTIVMLISVAMLAGKKFYDRFAYFLYAFAVWDIFYYVFLKLILGWPDGFFTWDILFLIPIPWIGPWITPVICALIMIVIAFLIIHFQDKGYKVRIELSEWVLFFIGVILVLYTWLYDYTKIIFGGGFAGKFFSLVENKEFIDVVSNYTPLNYHWGIYLVGVAFVIVGVWRFYRRTKIR